MSASNGVIKIGRKGTKKFAFGDDGVPFEVDVVVAFQQWIGIDEQFRQQEGEREGTILTEDYPGYHQAAVEFVQSLTGSNDNKLTVAEALDFIARLREQYDELAVFFRPKRLEKDALQDTSEVELQFSEEKVHSPTSTN